MALNRNPWLDKMLPADALEPRIRYVVETVYPVTPVEQRKYFADVVLSLVNCPDDIRTTMEAVNG